MKDYDDTSAVETRALRDRAFLAAVRARTDGFSHTARALDAIVEELTDAPHTTRRAPRR